MNQETKLRMRMAKSAHAEFRTNPASAINSFPKPSPAPCRSDVIRRSGRRTAFMPS